MLGVLLLVSVASPIIAAAPAASEDYQCDTLIYLKTLSLNLDKPLGARLFANALSDLLQKTRLELNNAYKDSAKLFNNNKKDGLTIASTQLRVFIREENPAETGLALRCGISSNLKPDASKTEHKRLKAETIRIGEAKLKDLDLLTFNHRETLDRRVPGATVLDVTLITIAKKS